MQLGVFISSSVFTYLKDLVDFGVLLSPGKSEKVGIEHTARWRQVEAICLRISAFLSFSLPFFELRSAI